MKVLTKDNFIRGSVLAAALLSTSVWAATTSFTDTYSANGFAGGTACNQSSNITGQEPAAAGTFPVFIYMVGTTETGNNNGAASAAVAGMANRGYVAASVSYNTTQFGNCTQIGAKAQCIFNPNSAASAVSKLCARAKADCSKGVVVGGFSQGAVMATLAKNFDGRVRAAWGMGDGDNYSSFGLSFNLAACMDNGNHTLTSDHLRIVNGERDDFMGQSANTVRTEVQNVTGLNCGANAFNCLQGNGSGWYIVQNAQVQDGTADHCYMRANGGCFSNANALDSGWQNGGDVWELNANLDWLTTFTAR